MKILELTKAPTPTQEELDAEGRAWGYPDWASFAAAYEAEVKRLGLENEK